MLGVTATNNIYKKGALYDSVGTFGLKVFYCRDDKGRKRDDV